MRREVVFIEQHVGSHGGPYWGLWLACGHYVTRTMKRWHVGHFWEPPATAPKTVDCRQCADGQPSVPLPYDLFKRRLIEAEEGRKP